MCASTFSANPDLVEFHLESESYFVAGLVIHA